MEESTRETAAEIDMADGDNTYQVQLGKRNMQDLHSGTKTKKMLNVRKKEQKSWEEMMSSEGEPVQASPHTKVAVISLLI